MPHVDDPPRIAIYEDLRTTPRVLTVSESRIPDLVDSLTSRTYELARGQGGRFPYGIIREVVENLVHASFRGAVITILDGGNTVRVSDCGPGIRDKEAALRAGFTSADVAVRQVIKGVGAGLALVQEYLRAMGGELELDDNLGSGTVVTLRLPGIVETPLASAAPPSYNLPERQLKALLLTLELAPVGPTRIAQELGVSTSSAYRDLIALEGAGLVASAPDGHRSVTEAGLAYIGAIF